MTYTELKAKAKELKKMFSELLGVKVNCSTQKGSCLGYFQLYNSKKNGYDFDNDQLEIIKKKLIELKVTNYIHETFENIETWQMGQLGFKF